CAHAGDRDGVGIVDVIGGGAPGRDVDVQKNDPVVLKDWNVERRLIHGHWLISELSKRGLSEREGKNGGCENGVPHGASRASTSKRHPTTNSSLHEITVRGRRSRQEANSKGRHNRPIASSIACCSTTRSFRPRAPARSLRCIRWP